MSYSDSRSPLATRRRRLAVLCAALGLGAAPALAQQHALVVVPSVRLTETFTDNARLGQGKDASSDWITQIYPSLRLDARSARLTGNLNIGVNSALYANGSQQNANQLMLGGAGKVTAWENHAFIDLVGSVSRQPTYAFRPQGSDTVTGTNNLSEVRVFTVSPYLKGRFANTGTVEARYSATQTDSSASLISRTLTNVWSLNATDPYALGKIGWALNYRDSHTESTNRRDVDHASTRLTGLFAVDPQLTLRVIGGTESSNYTSVASRSTTIYGGGFDWRPTQFTSISGTVEDRFFGTGYYFNAEHRGPQVAFQGSYSRDVSSTSQSVLGAVTVLDLARLICASEPPSTRDACIQKIVTTSAGGNLSNMIVGAQSVLSNGFYLDRRMQLGVTFIGARNSISFIGFHSERNTLTENDFAVTADSTTNSSVKTTGGTIAAQHRLTPITSATVSFTGLRSQTEQTTGATTGPVAARSRVVIAGLTTNFTPKSTGSLNVRTNKGSGSMDYTENAIFGSVLLQF